MTNIYEAWVKSNDRITEQSGIPLLVSPYGLQHVYFEIRSYNMDGLNTGAITTTITRENAKILVRNLANWLDETELEARRAKEERELQ